jgi:hypothetical protein
MYLPYYPTHALTVLPSQLLIGRLPRRRRRRGRYSPAHPKLLFLSGYRARGGLPGGNFGLGRNAITSKSKAAGNVPFMFSYKLENPKP